MKRLVIILFLLTLCIPSLVDAQAVNPRDRSTFRCFTHVSTATSLTALTNCAAQTGLSYYITDITFSSSVISATAADSQLTIKYGTGGTCGSGTTVVWVASNLAFTTVSDHFMTPIKIPHGNELCWIHSPAGTKSVVVLGFIEK